MLLAIDVGNSNTSVGLFDRDKQLRFLASLDTDSRKTADQISIDLMNLFALYHFRPEDVTRRHSLQRGAAHELHDGEGSDPPAGQAAHGGGARVCGRG